MNIKLRDDQGNEYIPHLTDQIPYVVLENKRYEIVVSEDTDWISVFDNDPEIEQMMSESMDDLANGRVYRSEDAIRMIERGEI
jgi:hypothetical protein